MHGVNSVGGANPSHGNGGQESGLDVIGNQVSGVNATHILSILNQSLAPLSSETSHDS